MTRVLIAVDDSDTSLAAAQTAYRLFGDEAEYTVINVAENTPIEWGDDSLRHGTVYPLSLPGAGVVGGVPFVIRSSTASDLDSDRVDIAEQTADDIANEAGLPHAEPVGDIGDPADAIIQAATAHRADVIVVGTHDRGWFKRLVGSSVSDAVIRDSDIPVLVAR